MKENRRMKISRKILVGILALFILATAFSFVGCGDDGCEHEWKAATCTEPKSCALCGSTEGNPLGHTPNSDDGDCTTAVTCSVCGGVVTAAKTEHTWNYESATNEHDKHCTVCGYVAEEQTGHTHTFESVLSYDDGGHYYASTCGHTDVKKDYTAHSYSENVTEPTCTEQGYTSYTCECGKAYKDSYTSATGHEFEETMTSDSGGHWYKSACEHEVTTGYSAHSFESALTEPTCTEQGYTTFTCGCGYSYVGDYTSETGHVVLSWTEVSSALYDAKTCKHAVSYTGICSECDAPQQKTEYVEKHAFTYVVKEGFEATCVSEGTKLQFCKNADCKYSATAKAEVSYRDDSAHSWVADTAQTNSAMTSYHCTGCTATKNAVSASGTSANVSSENVGALDEIELNNAVIGFDQGIKDNLGSSGSDVEISAGTLEGTERETAIGNANLTPEEEALLGDKEIYNFTVTATENISNLGGTATIRIPYALSEREDADNIIVWYISDGLLTGIAATYADGYVTFTTTHFSYYVATTIAPEKLCEYLGGHDLTNVHVVLPTCTEGGYTVCIRCARQIEGSETAPLGHSWHTTVIVERDCTANGITKYECTSCSFSYETLVGATGHYYVLKDQKNATCSQSGSASYGCIYCDSIYTVTIPEINHNYRINVIAPSCEKRGYTEKTCLTCGDTLYTNYTEAVGHSYDSLWYQSPTGHFNSCITCGEAGEVTAHTPGAEATEESAQICTVCEYVIVPMLSHTHSLTSVEANEASCLENGNIAYFTCECGKWFLDESAEQLITDRAAVIVLAKGHTSESLPYVEPTCTNVGYTAGIKCSVCEVIIRGHVELPAKGHDYITTETAPTCTSDGVISKVCSICNDELDEEVIPKLNHKYTVGSIKAPSCTEDGFTTYVCTYCADSYTDDKRDSLGHNYSEGWIVSEDGHLRECTRCNERSELIAHVPSAEATEESAQICTVCEYVIEPIKNHTHRVSSAISQKAATCTDIGNTDYYVCTCGEWFSDEACKNIISNHVSVIIAALGHDITVTKDDAPTCTEDGYSTGYYCNRCDAYISGHKPLPPTGHSYADGVCTSCSAQDPNYVPPCEHYNEEIKGIAPTCTETGLTSGKRCKLCGKITVEQEVIPAKGHSFDEGKCTVCGVYENPDCTHANTRTEEIKATCTKDGLIKIYCESCGAKMSESEIKAIGHNYADGACTNCGESEGGGEGKKVLYTYTTNDLSLTLYSDNTASFTISGFDYDADGKLDSIDGEGQWSMSEAGILSVYTDYDEYSFTVNKDGTLVPYEKPICKHSNAKVTVIIEVTCEEDGLVEKSCPDCKKIFTETVFATGHVFENGICTACGISGMPIVYTYESKTLSFIFFVDFTTEYTEIVYTEDGMVIRNNGEGRWNKRDGMVYTWTKDTEYIFVIVNGNRLVPYEEFDCAHKNTETETVEPTCVTDGRVTVFCKDCETIVSERHTTAFGHSYIDGACTICGEKEDGGEIIPPDACWHPKTLLEITEATCTSPSYQRIVCADCGEIVEEKRISEPIGHSYVDGVCKYCGDGGDIIPPDACGHPKTLIEVTEANCMTGAYRRVRCTDCGEVIEKTLLSEPTEHIYENGRCVICGYGDEEYTKEVLYYYNSKELTLTLYTDGSSDYFMNIYAEDGSITKDKGTDKWFDDDRGVIHAYTPNGEYLFTATEWGELIPYVEQ